MRRTVGIRRETIDATERRAPLTPAQVRRLVGSYETDFVVEPSPLRVFPDEDYAAAGAALSPDLSDCNVVFGVKEIPVDHIRPAGAYCFFSHTIKAQSYNMPMLKHIVDVDATLLDYELVTTAAGKRLIFFGNYAGYAGMIDALWALGRRLESEGLRTPFSAIKRARDYESLTDAETAIVEVGQCIQREGLPPEITPFVCLFTGRGNVAKGAQRVYGRLPAVRLQPEEVIAFATSGEYSNRVVYGAELLKQHLYRRRDGGAFDVEDFSEFPERYEGRLTAYFDHMTMLVNGIYWAPRSPRLLTREFMRERYRAGRPRLRVVGDITCDIEGSIEFTVRATTSDNPVFVYEPGAERVVEGWEGDGPVVLAVDKLPAELPRESTQTFGEFLAPFIPSLARADFRRGFDKLEIPMPFKRAVIVHRGELTERFRYLERHLG